MKEYKYKINGNSYKVTIGDIEDNIAHVEVNGTHYKVEMEKQPKPAAKPVVRHILFGLRTADRRGLQDHCHDLGNDDAGRLFEHRAHLGRNLLVESSCVDRSFLSHLPCPPRPRFPIRAVDCARRNPWIY